MNATPKTVLYWSSAMVDDTANLNEQLQALGSSGFNNILLWSLHVNSPIKDRDDIVLGDLTWNDQLLVSSKSGKTVFDPTGSFTKLAGRLNALVDAGKTIFFSIGSEPPNDRPGDFATIKQLYSTSKGKTLLKNNFDTLLEKLTMLSGFDFDVEDAFDKPSTAWLTGMLGTDSKKAITYCPFGQMEWWEECLESVFQACKKTQPVVGFNLQCYSGGRTQNPGKWADYIETNKEKNGVADLASFIVPGYPASNTEGDGDGGICPDVFMTTLTRYKGKIGGAFVWNSHHIFDDAAPCENGIPSINDYATAITKALQ